MKFLKFVVFIVSTTILIACAPKKKVTYTVTGKGNGGNGLAMSSKEIKKRVKDIKPHLIKLFEGLKNLNHAENMMPKSTDLSEFPRIKNLISSMTDPRNSKNIFSDIQTENNLEVIDEPCIDHQGFENVGAAKPGDIHGTICISVSELRKISPKGAESAVDIQLLSIAAHEFAHHFLNNEDQDEDGNLIRTLQAFINYELHKYEQTSDENSISTNEMPFLDHFINHSRKILKQVEESNNIKEDK